MRGQREGLRTRLNGPRRGLEHERRKRCGHRLHLEQVESDVEGMERVEIWDASIVSWMMGKSWMNLMMLVGTGHERRNSLMGDLVHQRFSKEW